MHKPSKEIKEKKTGRLFERAIETTQRQQHKFKDDKKAEQR